MIPLESLADKADHFYYAVLGFAIGVLATVIWYRRRDEQKKRRFTVGGQWQKPPAP